MQVKSDKKCHFAFNRIDQYHIHTGKTWAEVASDLGVGVSALMMVKSGKRGVSDKVIYRLAQAEIAAGIEAPVTDSTTMQELDDLESRTGQSISDFLSPAARRREILWLRESIEEDKQMLEKIQERIRRDQKRLKVFEARERSEK
jgi:transcriptional regulator with XRE-family HTH domain